MVAASLIAARNADLAQQKENQRQAAVAATEKERERREAHLVAGALAPGHRLLARVLIGALHLQTVARRHHDRHC